MRSTNKPPAVKQGSPLLYFLVFMSCLFIGILIFTYVVTKKTHPLYTDQQGNTVNAESKDNKSSSKTPSK